MLICLHGIATVWMGRNWAQPMYSWMGARLIDALLNVNLQEPKPQTGVGDANFLPS